MSKRDNYVKYGDKVIDAEGDEVPCEPFATLDGEFTKSQLLEIITELERKSAEQSKANEGI